MSEQRGPEVSYRHFDDCHSSGCRGHKIKAIINTSGYLRFEDDGVVVEFGTYFDVNQFAAMIEAERLRAEEWK